MLTPFDARRRALLLQAERIANVSILNYTGRIYALAFGVFILASVTRCKRFLGSRSSLPAWCLA